MAIGTIKDSTTLLASFPYAEGSAYIDGQWGLDFVYTVLSGTFANNIKPSADNTYLLGISTGRWKEVNAVKANVDSLKITFASLATSTDGLAAGDIWRNGNVLTVCTG